MTGTWRNGRPAASAIGRRSGWFDTTRAMSPPRVPARQRKIRSFRQCPNFDTITSSRGLVSSWKAKLMPNSLGRRGERRGEPLQIQLVLGGEGGAEEEDLAFAVVELVVLDDVEAVSQQEAGDGLDDAGPLRAGQGQHAEGPLRDVRLVRGAETAMGSVAESTADNVTSWWTNYIQLIY